jgi:myo-inositol 2-dehydrogenase/D-chiro-inositol 1-dehydrogenase
VELMREAYTSELAELCHAIQDGRAPAVGADDAFAAFAIAQAAIDSTVSGSRAPVATAVPA